VTNFGAFVDIGVHQDGLVHISSSRTVFVKRSARCGQRRRPGERAGVIEVKLDKQQIALSMKSGAEVARGAERKERGHATTIAAAGRRARAHQHPHPSPGSPSNNPSRVLEKTTPGSS